jgi:3-methyladenine DNA glycosylase Tag
MLNRFFQIVEEKIELFKELLLCLFQQGISWQIWESQRKDAGNVIWNLNQKKNWNNTRKAMGHIAILVL